MSFAYPIQKFQDWFTQQWVILRGRKFDPNSEAWLYGPYGGLEGIGSDFIQKLADEEDLLVEKNHMNSGLLNSIDELGLSQKELDLLSEKVIDFYEHTSSYSLGYKIKWNPFFRFFGVLVSKLFSKRIDQLNLPTLSSQAAEEISSDIIQLKNGTTGEVKHTFWQRTNIQKKEIIYLGRYGSCELPSGQKCVKAVFPLPKGNATVILFPKVGKDGSLSLVSSGKRFGNAGFYFLLEDAKGRNWAQFIKTFRDELTIFEKDQALIAHQKLTLWGVGVLSLKYTIEKSTGSKRSFTE